MVYWVCHFGMPVGTDLSHSQVWFFGQAFRWWLVHSSKPILAIHFLPSLFCLIDMRKPMQHFKSMSMKRGAKPFGLQRHRLTWYLLRLHRISNSAEQNGYIMYVILLLVLTVMGTTIALADRTTSGLAGQMRQSSLRDAELATENGLARTIADMNSPANRYIWGVKTDDWTEWNVASKLYPNDKCRKDASTGSKYFPNNDPDFVVNGSTEVFKRIKNRKPTTFDEEWVKGFIFQIIGVSIKDEKHQAISNITDKNTDGTLKYPKGPSYVEFRVRGIHNSNVKYDTNYDNTTNGSTNVLGWRDDNTKWSTAMKIHDVSFEITREYKLAPFCCKTGFIDKKDASDTRSYGSALPKCDTTYNPDDYNLDPNNRSNIKGLSDKEKMGWTIVGPSSTGIFRSSL